VIALVDESILLSGSGAYLVACVVLPDGRRAAVRRDLRRLLPAGRVQMHWRNEEARERTALTALLAKESTGLFVYGKRPAVRRDHEPARARLLQTMFEDLAPADVLELLIESRQSPNDQKDRHTISALQAAGLASYDLEYIHRLGREEPLLWLADALAGAMLASLKGEGRFLASLPADRLRVRWL
jgi:hypothetical protein